MIHRKLNGDHFALLSIDVGERKELVRRLVKDADLPYPVLLDTDAKVSKSYGVRAHPVAYVIDPEGYIVGLTYGYKNWHWKDVEGMVRALLAEY
jgi:peroxiredoxin